MAVKKNLNKLGQWMKENRYSDPLFAELVSQGLPKPVTPHTVFNWRHGLRIPRSASMAQIMKVTNNEVQPGDFILVEQQ